MNSERDFPATAEGLSAAAEFLDEACPNPRISIIFDEIGSNIVRCSGATAFKVGLSRGDGILVMEISDDGVPFDPTAQAEPDTSAPVEERKIGGLGIMMVRKMSRSFRYRREGTRNFVTIEVDL